MNGLQAKYYTVYVLRTLKAQCQRSLKYLKIWIKWKTPLTSKFGGLLRDLVINSSVDGRSAAEDQKPWPDIDGIETSSWPRHPSHFPWWGNTSLDPKTYGYYYYYQTRLTKWCRTSANAISCFKQPLRTVNVEKTNTERQKRKGKMWWRARKEKKK